MDRLKQLIDQIARDTAPKMLPFVAGPVLISGPTTWKQFDEPANVDQAVLDHAGYDEAVAALAGDSVLGQLAPKDPRGGPMLAAGDTWRQLSASTLVPSLIAAASSELRALGTKPSPDALAAIAVRNVERCRDIALRRMPEVVTVLGFSGIEVPADQAVALPWGVFTARTGWYGIAEYVQSRPLTCVLIAHHPLPVDMGANVGPPRESKAHSAHAKWAESVTRLVTLSVVFATSGAVAPLPTFQLTILPFQAPMSAGGPMILAPPSALRELDEADVLEVVRWGGILQKRYSPTLEVAGRRLIAALAHRIDPADRLIDAVTAWEALFGGQQEATLRVSGSIGWLLESHRPPARLELQREASEIYGLRSKVVHGKVVSREKVHAAADRATQLAEQSLRRILEGRPDLIPLESEERSRRLLFEGSVLLTPP
jgi:hypothetical protein